MKHVPVTRIALWSLFGFVAVLQVSIAAAQALLAVVVLCWLAMVASGRARGLKSRLGCSNFGLALAQPSGLRAGRSRFAAASACAVSAARTRLGLREGSDMAEPDLPLTMGTALHFDTWVPNFGIQEYMRHTPETDAVFPHDYRFEDGHMIVGESPGHGVTIDEALAAQDPYTPMQLPVARLEDGTMWNW
jgi:hypothetical protein